MQSESNTEKTIPQPNSPTPLKQEFPEEIVDTPEEPADVETPSWLKIICGIALVFMANQVHPASSGILHKLYVSDIAFLVAAVVVFFHLMLNRKRTIHLSWLCLLPVLAVSAANIMSATGMGGLAEACQTAVTFIGGLALFSFMLRHAPLTALLGVTGGLVLNLIAATWQDFSFGAFVTIAPKDIIELPYGIGNAMTGLFRSKIAFSCYLAVVLPWVIPQWLNSPFADDVERLLRRGACFLLAAWGILLIPHAMFAILAIALIIMSAFAVQKLGGFIVAASAAAAIILAFYMTDQLHVEAWKSTISPLKGYHYVQDASVLFNQPKPVIASEPSEQAAELKTCHYDFIAALRLAARNPLWGIGSGNYQKSIGAAYSLDEDRAMGQLPATRINDIETDSQAGWGILAATLGFPAVILFAIFFLAALGRNLWRIIDDEEDGHFLHIAGAASITAFILAMFLTDPTIRGLCWFMALALASAETGPDTRKLSLHARFNTFYRARLLVLGAIAAVFVVAAPSGPTLKNAFNNSASAPAKQGKPAAPAVETPVESAKDQNAQAEKSESGAAPKEAVTASTPSEPADKAEPDAAQAANATQAVPPEALVAEDSDELFLVFNADKATDITMPMQKQDDGDGTYASGLLVIPDKAGVPPAGKNPALEYGGAVFHFVVKRETTAFVWCNVLWDGSCGNTLDVRLDGEKATYTVGNDGTYNAWHWQKSPKSCKLTPGLHRLEVLNREDGIKLAQVLVLNDKEYIPDGVEGE